MALPSDPSVQRRIARALIASAIMLFALALAFWNGLIPIEEAIRPTITGAIVFAALLDLGIAIVLMRRAAS
jgi:hypothetical protein